jgi:SPP1 gp7 family putative phage head morphogenesis protein
VIKRQVKSSVESFKLSGDKTRERIEHRIVSGMTSGERHESIARGIEGLLSLKGDEQKSAKKRARFIARNTVSDTLGEINMVRQTSNGIDLYKWQTAEDERVRPTHEDLNGHIFSWHGTVTVNGTKYNQASDPDFNDGAPTIPGKPYNCRCVGLAYIPELEE